MVLARLINSLRAHRARVRMYHSPHYLARASAQGDKCGYPECCVDAFVDDLRRSRNPAKRRGTISPAGRFKNGNPRMKGAYVPCSACMGGPNWTPPRR